MANYKCGMCLEVNALASTRCKRCDQILPWGFLHDSSLVDEEAKAPLWTRWLDLFLNPNRESPKCRYCNEAIMSQTLVCPHCRRMLRMRTEGSFGIKFVEETVPESPELRALVERFLAKHPQGY